MPFCLSVSKTENVYSNSVLIKLRTCDLSDFRNATIHKGNDTAAFDINA